MMYFTFEEQNLVAMQSCTDRRKAMLGLYNTLGILKDPDLIEMTQRCINKLRKLTDEEYVMCSVVCDYAM